MGKRLVLVTQWYGRQRAVIAAAAETAAVRARADMNVGDKVIAVHFLFVFSGVLRGRRKRTRTISIFFS